VRRAPSRLLGGGALLFLAACSSSGSTDYAQYWEMMKQSFGTSRITLQQASDIPYASMGWRLNGGPQNIIVLASDNNREQMWTSAARIVLVTKDGRIKRTVGLPHDVTAVVPVGGGDLQSPSVTLKMPSQQQYTADFPDAGIYGARIACRSVSKGARAITILEQRIPTVRIEENCSSTSLRWSFTNVYWTDPQTGFVWRSRQTIHPGGDTLETEIFRPPA
jgi:hypothetical protein